jgi:hypothetical protein
MRRLIAVLAFVGLLSCGSDLLAFNVTLEKFECKNQQESTPAGDQIYFKVFADGAEVTSGWGENVRFVGKKGQTTEVNKQITANNSIVINVYEHDGTNSDSLGTITITAAATGSKQLTGKIGLGVFDYTFHWKP